MSPETALISSRSQAPRSHCHAKESMGASSSSMRALRDDYERLWQWSSQSSPVVRHGRCIGPEQQVPSRAAKRRYVQVFACTSKSTCTSINPYYVHSTRTSGTGQPPLNMLVPRPCRIPHCHISTDRALMADTWRSHQIVSASAVVPQVAGSG